VDDGILPARLRSRGGGLGKVAKNRHRAGRTPPGDCPQLHGREVLSLVDDGVAVGAADPVEQRVGLVDQHELGERPRLVVEPARPGAAQQERLLSGVEDPRGRLGERPLVREHPLHQHGRRERRPDLRDRRVQRRVRPHLGVEGGAGRGVLPAGVGVAEPRQPPHARPEGVATHRKGDIPGGDLLHRFPQSGHGDAQRSPSGAHRQVLGRHAEVVAGGSRQHRGHADVTLEARHGGLVLPRHPTPHEALHGGLARGRLAERWQHLGDVPEEQRVRSDHEHTLPVELVAVLEEQEGGAVKTHSRLAGARPALHHEARVDGGPDHHVLLRGDGGDDVAHLARARALQLRQQRVRDAPVVGGVHAVGVVEHLVEEVIDLPGGHHEAPPAHQVHGVGRGGPVERRRHRRPPVHHHGVAPLVLDVTATHVPGVPVLGVEAPEAEPVDLGVERPQPGVEVGLGDGGVDGPGGGLGERRRLLRARPHPGEVGVGPVEVGLLEGKVGVMGHGAAPGTRACTPVRCGRGCRGRGRYCTPR